MFEHFSSNAIAVILQAQEEARRLGHNFVGTEQLLLGLIKEGSSIAAKVLTDFGMTLSDTRIQVEAMIGRGDGGLPAEIPFTPKLKQVFEQAFQEARKLDYPYIEPEHLLLGLIQNSETVAYRVLENLGIDPTKVRTQVIRALGETSAVPTFASKGLGRISPLRRPNGKALAEFGVDLTQLAAAGQLDPIVGRQPEIERVIQILGRRTKNNPVLVGEPGVGKTAIAEGLAQRIVNQEVPEALLDQRVISLDMSLLIAGARFRGDFEERLTQILAEVRQAQNIILVIDELHTLVGAGSLEGGMDAANLLKPALARGELKCIGATTLDEYRQRIERDAALERRFQPVMVEPPSVDETIDILCGLRGRYEQFHRLTITDGALEAAAKFSDRYITDRHLPDKAIDLIDEAGSRVRLRYTQRNLSKELKREMRQVRQAITEAVQRQDFVEARQLRDRQLELENSLQQTADGPIDLPQVITQQAPIVNVDDIADIVASWTGIPVNRLTESESALLTHLEDTLHQRLIGQEEAVTAVARAIRRARVGLSSPNRPIASLIFSGPTGVGKTELAKALAATVFGSEAAMVRLDMSEYMEAHTVSKLIGSPPGFVGYEEGGRLTEAVRRQPYTVVLLDEIEKAHPDIFNLLLQLLEEGQLTDSQGRSVSFKNTLLIMTSNIGSKVIEKGGGGLGFELSLENSETTLYNGIRSLVHEELKQYFRPELLNRIDEIIVFRQLNRREVKQIADLMIQEVTHRLAERQIQLKLTEAVKEHLVVKGFDPRYGARPLRRAITTLIEDHLAEAILDGRIQDGITTVLDIDADGRVQVQPEEQSVLVAATR